MHVVGPEQGFTLPGTTIVCGDSHTSTHGAFGALAHGIGTSEVEHVLATQTLIQKKARNMKVEVNGKLASHSTAKDIILAIGPMVCCIFPIHSTNFSNPVLLVFICPPALP